MACMRRHTRAKGSKPERGIRGDKEKQDEGAAHSPGGWDGAVCCAVVRDGEAMGTTEVEIRSD